MPITKTHCLYVEPTNDPKADFEKQCDILIDWKKNNINPYKLFNLEKNYTLKDLHRAKIPFVLMFHPDKNEQSHKSTEAFKILNAAIKYLELNLTQDEKLRHNMFHMEELRNDSPQPQPTKPQGSAMQDAKNWYDLNRAEYSSEEMGGWYTGNAVRNRTPEEKHRAMNQSMQEAGFDTGNPEYAYTQQLQKIAASAQMQEGDINFFINLLSISPEFFSLTTSIDDEQIDLLGLFLLKKCSVIDFVSLCTLLQGRVQFADRSHKSYMAIALETTNLSFLRFVMKAENIGLGMRAFKESNLDEELWRIVLQPDFLYFILDELNYKPKKGTDMSRGLFPLLDSLDKLDFFNGDSFSVAYKHFVDYSTAAAFVANDHGMDKDYHFDQYINPESLFMAALNKPNVLALRQLDRLGLLKTIPKDVPLIFQPDFISFIKKPKAEDMLWELKSLGYVFDATSLDLKSFSSTDLTVLIKKDIIKPEALFTAFPHRSPIWLDIQLIDSLARSTMMKGYVLTSASEKCVSELFASVCTSIARDPNPIEAGKKYHDLLAKLVDIFLHTAGGDKVLRQTFDQEIYIANLLSLRSFTPMQLLVLLQHTEALTLVEEKSKYWSTPLKWEDDIHFDRLLPAESKQEKRQTLLDLAYYIRFKDIAKLQKLNQLQTAKEVLREIKLERASLFDFFSNTKKSKVSACQALIDYNQSGTLISEHHKEILSKDLAYLVAISPIQYQTLGIARELK